MKRLAVPGTRPLPAALAAGALIAAASVLPGCVSAVHHQEVAAERDKLARENAQLRRALAEQRVREEEARDAARGPVAAASSRRAPQAREAAASREPDPLSAPPLAPVGRPAAEIWDEDVRTVQPPGASVEPGDAEGTLRVARHHASSGRHREAIDAYSRLIRDHPFSPLLPATFLERGRLRLSTGDRQGALEDFDTVLEAFPRSPEAAEARRQAASLRGR